MRSIGRLAAAAAAVFMAVSAHAVVLMDQIGPDGSATNGQVAVHSQILEAANQSFSDSAVDNFILPTAYRITHLDAGMRAFGGATLAAFGNVTGWDVAIYSTALAPTTTQTGDVANITLAPGAVTVTTGFNSNSLSALVSMDLSIELAAGEYWLALLPRLPLAGNGQLGVYLSTFAGTPGDNNGFLANPGGGGGFNGNRLLVGEDLAYRLEGVEPMTQVPEPTSAALLAAGLLGLLGVTRRARQTDRT